ncbi:MAG: hypothetical protein ACLU22_08475 [Clostridium sp.]
MEKRREKMSILRDETGAVAIVEATFVFPIMFFCPVFHNDDGKYLLSTGTN